MKGVEPLRVTQTWVGSVADEQMHHVQVPVAVTTRQLRARKVIVSVVILTDTIE